MQTLEVIARCFNTSVSYLKGETNDMKPDFLVISRTDNPIMFELVASLQNSDDNSIRRLLVYSKALTKEETN